MTTLTRRDWLRLAGAGALGVPMSGWIGSLAADAAKSPQRKRACILLWMPGGPSQTDTFDLKPDHKNGGPFKPIKTSAPGLEISEHLSNLARMGEYLVPVRSMATRQGDHSLATYEMRTGYRMQAPIQYPQIGSVLAHELASDDVALPPCVSIAPQRFFNQDAYGAGFLGANYASLVVGERGFSQTEPSPDDLLRMENARPPADLDAKRLDTRLGLLAQSEKEFRARHLGAPVDSHKAAYDRAVRLVRSEAGKAFTLSEEKDKLRDEYGRNLFGQGCLLARRLVERGVPFVEVALTGNNGIAWDTHAQNFTTLKDNLLPILDAGWATLLRDLKDRGLLDTTLVVWMGEFGRTPVINGAAGRDHFPNAWTAVLSGGGVKGGQAVGKTSKDGTTVTDRPVNGPDFLATVCLALGIDPAKQNQSNVGRPIRLADPAARPLTEIVTTKLEKS